MNTQKAISIRDCQGPRPEYWFDARTGTMGFHTQIVPGPAAAISILVFWQRNSPDTLELLWVASFWLN
jgi:hypothetical protein